MFVEGCKVCNDNTLLSVAKVRQNRDNAINIILQKGESVLTISYKIRLREVF